MRESERHRLILSVIQSRPFVSVGELVELTDSSEATIRRDVATLHLGKKLRRVRGGVEPMAAMPVTSLAGRPFSLNATVNIAQKRAIARMAADLCEEGEAIIINGGTTTFQMVHPLASRRLQVFTNSFPIAEHLLHHSRNTVMLPGGTIYREQNIVLSPFENDATRNFYARRMFMGAQGVGPLGVMEQDPLIIHAEEKLIGQADEVVLLVDATKFTRRSALILCPLARIHTVITDDRLEDREAAMLEDAGVKLLVAPASAAREDDVAGPASA